MSRSRCYPETVSGFKIVFGSKGSEIPLRALLNALLDRRGPDRIARVEIVNPRLEEKHLKQRAAILDVKVRDENRKQYNLELQVRCEPFFVERSLYYDSRHYGDPLVKNQKFDRLAPTVFIGLLDFIVFPDGDESHSSFSLRHDRTGRLLTDHLTFHCFELPRLGKTPPQTIATPAEAWLNLLKFGHLYLPGAVPLPVEIMREEGVAMAIDRLKKARDSEEARAWAETYDKARRTHLTAVSEARKEGRAEGRKQGLEEGVEIGRQQTLEESLRTHQLDTARRMIALGDDDRHVADVTGLELTDIKTLRDN